MKQNFIKISRNIVLIFFAIVFLVNQTQAEVITGIHINAIGNNRYEAKIRAHFDGMKQSLNLIANKIGVTNAYIDNVPYDELKAVFKVHNIISEKSFDERYTANVNYSYDNLAIHHLLMKYGNEDVKKQFFEYVVIPVFKQRNVIQFLDSKTEWLETWIENQEICNKNGMLVIDPLQNAVDITSSNVFNLSYENFLDRLKIKKFKNILIAVCEYFTKPDGSMYFKVITYKLTSDGQRYIADKYYDISDPAAAEKYFGIAIHEIITGLNPSHDADKNIDVANAENVSDLASDRNDKNAKAGSVLDSLLVQTKASTQKLTKIEMKLDVFDNQEIENIKVKLAAIPEVVKYHIDMEDAQNYKITLHINTSLEDLAESLYFNNLSFRLYDEEYTMFELHPSGI